MQNSPIPGAILFDLDSTIITSSISADTLWHDICHRHAELLEGTDGDRLLEAVHKYQNWYWGDLERHRRGRLNLLRARRELVELAFTSLNIDNSEVSRSLADEYTTQREEMIKLFPKAIETLSYFKDAGLKLALVTNGASDVQRRKIERFRLELYFDCIVVEGEFGAGKPDRSVFIHALDTLGVTPGEAWMVGDDLARDIEGAQNAGIYSIWVDWRNEGLSEEAAIKPDRIINTISELV